MSLLDLKKVKLSSKQEDKSRQIRLDKLQSTVLQCKHKPCGFLFSNTIFTEVKDYKIQTQEKLC